MNREADDHIELVLFAFIGVCLFVTWTVLAIYVVNANL